MKRILKLRQVINPDNIFVKIKAPKNKWGYNGMEPYTYNYINKEEEYKKENSEKLFKPNRKGDHS